MPAGRMILHIDMDAYFASLEAQACPALAGRPLVVGALPGSRGVVSSASYEARAFGIRAGMPAAQARRLCPRAEFVPCHPALYIHTTRRLLRHLLGLTPRVEMFSIDEAFLDITDLLPAGIDEASSWQAAETLARRLVDSIAERFQLGCSAGVGPNKVVAKMAAKVHKPRGLTLMGQRAFQQHFWPKPVEQLYGVGVKTASALMIFGIETIGDLAQTPAGQLVRRFGVYGEALHALAWGSDESPVVPSHEAPPAKSLGHEHTLARDVESPEEALSLLLALTDRVARDLRSEGYASRCVAVKIRYSDFSSILRQKALAHPTQETRDLYRTAKELFLGHYCGEGIRLLGVTAAQLGATEGRLQLGLFPEDRRQQDLLRALDRIRDEHGGESVLPAGALRAQRRASPVRAAGAR